jgi:monoamine oxidase
MVDTEISGLTSASSGHGSEAILSLFVGGQTAARLGVLSVSERRDHILGRLGKAFGPEALTPLSYDETLWMQSALTPGGYNAHLKANGRTDAPFILAKRFGNCVLASSELSTRFSGFTEGACFAGITAAKVLLKG